MSKPHYVMTLLIETRGHKARARVLPTQITRKGRVFEDRGKITGAWPRAHWYRVGNTLSGTFQSVPSAIKSSPSHLACNSFPIVRDGAIARSLLSARIPRVQQRSSVLSILILIKVTPISFLGLILGTVLVKRDRVTN